MAKKKRVINKVSVQAMAYLLDCYSSDGSTIICVPIDNTAIPDLEENGLLAGETITEKGRVYIEALLKVKLPIRVWK